MPAQDNRLGYPCSVSYRGKGGRLFHQHRIGWLNCIHAKRGRRMYLKANLPTGEVVFWLNTRVVKEMVKFLEKDKPLEGPTPGEKEVLYAKARRKTRK